MRVKRIVTAVMAGCAAVVMSTVSGLAAQTPHEPQHAATDTVKPPSGMAAKCQAMMADREKMMTDMKAADQRLDGLVATMNTASGMEKMAATATVVTEMVTQRRTMQDGMMKMEQGMMAHMEHMQAGTGSMAMCPMMKPTPIERRLVRGHPVVPDVPPDHRAQPRACWRGTGLSNP